MTTLAAAALTAAAIFAVIAASALPFRKAQGGPMRLLHRWRTRGHDTSDMNCIHWSMWSAIPAAGDCGPCALTGGYVAQRHAEIDAEADR